jgi:hypothetical protein
LTPLSCACPLFHLPSSASRSLRYNRIDLFAPAGVTYVNGSSLQVPFFSLAPVSFKSPEAFVPSDASRLNFRNVQALVDAVNSGASPMPKSSAFVGDGLTVVAEAELKALSLLANRWPSRNMTRVSSLVDASPVALKLLSTAAVFAVAVSSAVAFEFPGRTMDGLEQSTSEATQISPAFASSLSNLNSLSLVWSATSSTVVASVPVPFPARQPNNLIPRRLVAVFMHLRVLSYLFRCFVFLFSKFYFGRVESSAYIIFVPQRTGRVCCCRCCHPCRCLGCCFDKCISHHV